MKLPQRDLREQLRAASQALSQAEIASGSGRNIHGHRGVSDAQFTLMKQNLARSARKHLASAAELALKSFPAAQTQLSQVALAAAWSNLAELALLGEDKDAAISAYERTIDLTPGNRAARAQLATLLEARHDLPNAKRHAELVVRDEPDNFVAAMTLSRVLIREEKFAEAERAALAAANAVRVMPDHRALAWSLVGEARDRRGSTGAAFKAFQQSNDLMRRRYEDVQEMTHPAHPANVRAMTRFIAQADAQKTAFASATPAPAFLIGFPRSGTTLIEQVLASHSRIACFGETDYLFGALSTVLKEGDLLERVASLTHAEIEIMRAAFQSVVLADHPEAAGRLIIDKHPLHIVLLPVINKVFPDAKIIFTQRDPRDVVLSCYQQCFGVNVATAQFWRLDRAAEYYDVVMELALTARKKLKLDLLEVDYRDVVADLEKEAQRMAAFLGLAFEPSMLRYDETARQRAISSASARQVISPIYDRSIGRWRRYAKDLAPVLPLLDKWARRLGYEE
jgi:tetratricopeptide (TPR) repeat protein